MFYIYHYDILSLKDNSANWYKLLVKADVKKNNINFNNLNRVSSEALANIGVGAAVGADRSVDAKLVKRSSLTIIKAGAVAGLTIVSANAASTFQVSPFNRNYSFANLISRSDLTYTSLNRLFTNVVIINDLPKISQNLYSNVLSNTPREFDIVNLNSNIYFIPGALLVTLIVINHIKKPGFVFRYPNLINPNVPNPPIIGNLCTPNFITLVISLVNIILTYNS